MASEQHEQMTATLQKLGIPYKRIHCYGSQIVVTAWSEDAALKWAGVLGKFAKVRGVRRSIDKTQDPTEIFRANPGLVKQSFSHEVWRIFATV